MCTDVIFKYMRSNRNHISLWSANSKVGSYSVLSSEDKELFWEINIINDVICLSFSDIFIIFASDNADFKFGGIAF